MAISRMEAFLALPFLIGEDLQKFVPPPEPWPRGLADALT